MTYVIWYYVLVTVLMLIEQKGDHVISCLLWPLMLPLGAMIHIMMEKEDKNE